MVTPLGQADSFNSSGATIVPDKNQPRNEHQPQRQQHHPQTGLSTSAGKYNARSRISGPSSSHSRESGESQDVPSGGDGTYRPRALRAVPSLVANARMLMPSDSLGQELDEALTGGGPGMDDGMGSSQEGWQYHGRYSSQNTQSDMPSSQQSLQELSFSQILQSTPTSSQQSSHSQHTTQDQPRNQSRNQNQFTGNPTLQRTASTDDFLAELASLTRSSTAGSSGSSHHQTQPGQAYDSGSYADSTSHAGFTHQQLQPQPQSHPNQQYQPQSRGQAQSQQLPPQHVGVELYRPTSAHSFSSGHASDYSYSSTDIDADSDGREGVDLSGESAMPDIDMTGIQLGSLGVGVSGDGDDGEFLPWQNHQQWNTGASGRGQGQGECQGQGQDQNHEQVGDPASTMQYQHSGSHSRPQSQQGSSHPSSYLHASSAGFNQQQHHQRLPAGLHQPHPHPLLHNDLVSVTSTQEYSTAPPRLWKTNVGNDVMRDTISPPDLKPSLGQVQGQSQGQNRIVPESQGISPVLAGGMYVPGVISGQNRGMAHGTVAGNRKTSGGSAGAGAGRASREGTSSVLGELGDGEEEMDEEFDGSELGGGSADGTGHRAGAGGGTGRGGRGGKRKSGGGAPVAEEDRLEHRRLINRKSAQKHRLRRKEEHDHLTRAIADRDAKIAQLERDLAVERAKIAQLEGLVAEGWGKGGGGGGGARGRGG